MNIVGLPKIYFNLLRGHMTIGKEKETEKLNAYAHTGTFTYVKMKCSNDGAGS